MTPGSLRKSRKSSTRPCRPTWKRRYFLERLLALGDNGPLALLTMNKDGMPYLRMHRVTNLIGMVGLNEMVQVHLGKQLHESDDALKFGLKVIAYMKLLADKMSKKYNMRFVLEQTPAESTAYRFAKLDLRDFSPRSGLYRQRGYLPGRGLL